METTIHTQDLTKRYGEFTAVDSLDLNINRGEIYGLLGPNGAGKTTTILMLLGLSEPTAGEARVLDLDPARHPLEVKSMVGYLPDNVGFYAGLSGKQNLTYTARLNSIPREEAGRRIDSLLERVGLEGAGDQDAGTYSRGMRQRLGIADALLKEPQILILDEPTVGIDPEGVQDILGLIKELPQERGVTVLLSSHLLYQVQAICDRVGIFVKGRLIADGPLRELSSKLAARRVVVEVGAADTAEAREALEGLSGVQSVTREGEVFVVSSEGDTRYEISRALADKGIPIFHLRRRGEELDDIYRRYFHEGERIGR